ncbi:oligosaccharide flippase family protein [Oscillospiraceae bacterium PP1C4]
MKLHKKIGVFGNSLIYILMTVVQKGVAFLLLPLYTYLLLPEQYGIANIVSAIGSFYILLISFAVDDAVARYFFKFRDDLTRKQEFVGTILIFEIGTSVTSFVVLLLFNSIFYRPFMPSSIELKYIVVGVAIVSTTALYSVFQKVLIIQERALHYAVNTLTYFLMNTGLTILFIACLDMGAVGLLFATAITNIVFFIYSLSYLRLQAKWCWKREFITFVFQYSIHLIPNRLASWGLQNFNKVFLGKMLTAASVGIFNMGNNLASIISVFGNSFAFAYQPWIYSNLERGFPGKKKVSVIVNLSTSFFIIMGLAIALFMADIFNLFISSSYRDSLIYIPMLVFGQVVSCFTVISIYVLFYEDSMTKHISVSTLLGAATNILLCLVLIKPLGIMGTVIASAISQCIMYIYMTTHINMVEGISIQIKTPLMAASICLIISSYCILNNSVLWVKIVIFAVAVACFFITQLENICLALRFLTQEDG